MQRLAVAERAVELRIQGKTYREISEELGISKEAAHRFVKEEMQAAAKRRAEDADDYISIQHARLEKMYAALQHKIDMGDSRAVEVAMKVMEREAKLLGLDAPEKSQIHLTYEQMSDEDLREAASQARVQIAGKLPYITMALPGEVMAPENVVKHLLPEILDAEVVGESIPVAQAPAE